MNPVANFRKEFPASKPKIDTATAMQILEYVYNHKEECKFEWVGRKAALRFSNDVVFNYTVGDIEYGEVVEPALESAQVAIDFSEYDDDPVAYEEVVLSDDDEDDEE
jgi:hypothetical protein